MKQSAVGLSLMIATRLSFLGSAAPNWKFASPCVISHKSPAVEHFKHNSAALKKFVRCRRVRQLRQLNRAAIELVGTVRGNKMGLKVENQIADSFEDDVGICLRELHANRTWTGTKIKLFEYLMSLTKRERYLQFTGDFRDYHLTRKGQSCLYDVPPGQRGALGRFRGKRVRLICGGARDQYAGRLFLAKPVQVSSEGPGK